MLYESFFDELEKISTVRVGQLVRIAQRASELAGNPVAIGSIAAGAAGVAGLTGGISIGRRRRRKKAESAKVST